MPSSFVQVYVHIVFSTKDRYPFLDSGIRQGLFAYIGKTIKNMGGVPIVINGPYDHIHILMCLPKVNSLSKCVEDIKRCSSRWIKDKADGLKYAKFSWQNGYGAFSVSSSGKQAVVEYIQNQQQHHRLITFEEEFAKFLDKYNITYDSEYVWH
jgi:REP element-mobilizing transposase RayT